MENNTMSHGVKPSSPRGRPKGAAKQVSLQRYQLTLPDDLYKEIQDISEKEHLTVMETIRRLIKYGLLVLKLLRKPDSHLIIREGNVEREIVLI